MAERNLGTPGEPKRNVNVGLAACTYCVHLASCSVPGKTKSQKHAISCPLMSPPDPAIRSPLDLATTFHRHRDFAFPNLVSGKTFSLRLYAVAMTAPVHSSPFLCPLPSPLPTNGLHPHRAPFATSLPSLGVPIHFTSKHTCANPCLPMSY